MSVGDRRRQRAERARGRGAAGSRRPRGDRARGGRHDRRRDAQLGDDRARAACTITARRSTPSPRPRPFSASCNWRPGAHLAGSRRWTAPIRSTTVRPASLHRSIDLHRRGSRDATGSRWRRVFGPMAARFDDLLADATQPILRVPRHPLTDGALRHAAAMLPATVLARVWRHGAGQGALGRRGGARPLAPRPSDDQRGRADAAGRRRTPRGGSSPKAARRRSPMRWPPTSSRHGGIIETGRARDARSASSRRATC